MKDKMIKYIEENHLICKGDGIVVGVSGGADSVCLLYLLYECRQMWQLTLYVVHVHHGIRGVDADADALYVERLADELRLPFFCVRGDVPSLAANRGISTEEAGRDFRYQQMERIRQEQGADKIAVAHQSEDQAETVLFRLFRGSGARGLSGISPVRGRIIRPILFAGRSEIVGYLTHRQISWCTDTTNATDDYSRNYIRHHILPAVEDKINPKACSHIVQAAADIAKWRSYIEDSARKQESKLITATREGQEALLLSPLVQMDEVIRDEVLRIYVESRIPGAKDVTRVHYQQIIQMILRGGTGEISLPAGYVAEIYAGTLFIRLQDTDNAQSLSVICDIPSEHILEMEQGTFAIKVDLVERDRLDAKIPEKDYTKWIDYDKISNDLELRNPREGDFFVMDDKGHRKKLSRYYMDKKIPKKLRDRQVVVADGAHIVWAFPDRMSAAYKVTKNTKRVLVITKERVRYEGRDQGID